MKRIIRMITVIFGVLYIIGWIVVVPATQIESANFINTGLDKPISTELKSPGPLGKFSPYYRTHGKAVRKNFIGEEGGDYDEHVSSIAIQLIPFVVWYSVEFYSSGFYVGSYGISYFNWKGVKRKELSGFIT